MGPRTDTLQRVTRIAIFSVSAGAGHVRAAAALEAAARAWFPDVQATHVDLMSIVSPVFRSIYADGYLKVVRHAPALWKQMYAVSDATADESVFTRVREAVERANVPRFDAVLRDLAPDHVISTHFLPPQLVGRVAARGETSASNWVAVTDFDVHASWIQPAATGYLVADAWTAARAAERGINPALVTPTGIPISPVFAERWDRRACAEGFGLDPERPTVALMAGNAGVTPIDELASAVLALDPRLQVIAIAGRNPGLRARLDAVAAEPANRGRLHAMGHTTTIELVMAASDLAVTKPGGLTVSECLAMGLPMVIVSPIPGQEERNAAFVTSRGAAVQARTGSDVVAEVRRLLLDAAAGTGTGTGAGTEAGSGLESMRAAARILGKPFSARTALERVLGRAASAD